MTPLLRRHLPASARAVTVAVVALILTAAPAGAAPLTRATVPLFSISCTELAGPSATAALSADQQGVDEQASVAVWAPGSSTEDPAQLVSAGFTLARDDNAVTGTLPMVDADTGEDVGEASVRRTRPGRRAGRRRLRTGAVRQHR